MEIGGTAADVLRDLRKRILRDEKSFSQANLEFLLLDTDSATIDSACGDRCEDSLEFRETLHLPLRSSAEYREQSTDHLQWLSRRWLYNIPRSLRTEGRRPLGRLAFADHAERVKKRIREALVATADKIKLGDAGSSGHRKRLRVVIVSAIGGGTGAESLRISGTSYARFWTNWHSPPGRSVRFSRTARMRTLTSRTWRSPTGIHA